jgi:uncharacterized RDD family membrane protein YckC
MASADYTIATPERVSLEYGIAGIGSRGGAVLVDTFIQVCVLLLVTAALAGAALASSAVIASFSRGAGILVFGVWTLAAFAVSSGYFMVFEIVWSGQTPGKRLLGLRVIRESGYPIRPVDSMIRNLVRIVDWLPIGYGLGVLVMLCNRRSRRLGDFAGGTLVVREGPQRTLSAVAPPPASADEPRRYRLSSADATLVRDFLVRRGGMEDRARVDLARRLAAALAQRYQLALDASSDPEAFLEHLSG